MDLATVIGFVLAVGAVIGSALMEGGHLSALINPPALVLIVGGTLGTTTLSFPLAVILQLPRYTMAAVMLPKSDLVGRVREMVDLAQKARREGLLSLEENVAVQKDPFMKKGLQMIVDAAEANAMRTMLETEIMIWEQKEKCGEAVFTTMGGYSPTIGIIGTVLGLIHALGQMEDPKKMGAAIAGAFLATFYGVAFANLIFLPIAGKLKCRMEEATLIYEMTLEGLLAIQAGENPRMLEEKLSTYLPEKQRGQLTAVAAVEAGAAA